VDPAGWPPHPSAAADVQAALIDLTEDEPYDEPADPAAT
jgi:hypothetical protein